MKREIETYSLQLGDHLIFVDRGTRAEEHWVGLGYQDSAVVDSAPDEPGGVAEKPKRRSRKAAVEVPADE